MIPSLSQEELTQYASDAQTIQQPQGADYSQGVKAGRTIPAKWWNWLFSASTKRIIQSRTDANNILTELKNVVTDAGLTPTASDNTQLKQAVVAKADTQIDNFVARKQGYFLKWTGTAAPAAPSGWSSTIATLDYYYANHNYTNATNQYNYNCACFVAYPSQGSSSNLLKVSINADGKSWHPLVDVHTTYNIVDFGNYGHAVVHKFKGRYFLYIDGSTNSSHKAHAGEMFVSDDLKVWTSMFSIFYSTNASGVTTTADEYPAFGWSDTALYVMSKEGSNTSYTTKLRACYDGRSWETIATDFTYMRRFEEGLEFTKPYNAQKVIPVGENGFLWGAFFFDGTNFASVFPTTGIVPRSISSYNPCVFSSGKVLYATDSTGGYCWIAPYPGAQAVRVQLSENLDTRKIGRIVLGGKYIAYGIDSASEMYTASVGTIKLLDDTGTVTTFNHPPRAEGASVDYVPFELNGVTYCGKYKTTTDFEHWEMVQDLPEGTSSSAYLFDCADSSLIGFYDPVRDATLGGYKSFFSRDGTRWQQAETTSMHRGSILFTDCCWNCAPYPNTNGEVTYNSDNRVIGHTLYLR